LTDLDGGAVRGEAHADGAALERGAVQLLLGVLGVDARVELDEAEAALRVQEALARLAELLEQLLELGLGHVGGQVAAE